MYPCSAPTASAAIVIPSISTKGSPSMIMRSEKVPESPSSALQTTYFGVAGASAAVFHLMPVGNPAPPRPRRPDCVTSAITASAPISTARPRPRYPPCAMKSSSDTGSVTPARANVRRVCDFSHGISSATPRRSRCGPPSRKFESNSVATSRAATGPYAIRPPLVATSTIGSSENIPREPLRTILTSRLRDAASLRIASATASAPSDTALESRGTYTTAVIASAPAK